MNSAILCRGVRKSYARTRALDGVDLEIPAGVFVLLVGRNGSGKSTLLRALTGDLDCTGEIRVLGDDPRKRRGRPETRIAYRSETVNLPLRFRIADVLDLYGRIHPRFVRARAVEHLEAAGLGRLETPLASLSHGNLSRVEAAILLALDAGIVLLDEPLSGLDPVYRDFFWRELLGTYVDGERTLVVVTHRPEDAAGLFTHLAVLDAGRIREFEDAETLQQRYRSVLVGPERSAEARALHPLAVRPHWGREIVLFRDAPEKTLRELGEEVPTDLTTIVHALLEPSQRSEPSP
jgi:ABC-2 type transport system ATP-binding protein